MLIAAAVKFYISKTDDYVVLCGARHGDIFVQLQKLGFEQHAGYKEVEQGFIDNFGNFYDRNEAFVYAKECGQINKQETNGTLYSEDLW